MQGNQQRLDGCTLRKGFTIEWVNPDVDESVRTEAERLRQAGPLSVKVGKLIYQGQLISQTLVFPGDKLFSFPAVRKTMNDSFSLSLNVIRQRCLLQVLSC